MSLNMRIPTDLYCTFWTVLSHVTYAFSDVLTFSKHWRLCVRICDNVLASVGFGAAPIRPCAHAQASRNHEKSMDSARRFRCFKIEGRARGSSCARTEQRFRQLRALPLTTELQPQRSSHGVLARRVPRRTRRRCRGRPPAHTLARAFSACRLVTEPALCLWWVCPGGELREGSRECGFGGSKVHRWVSEACWAQCGVDTCSPRPISANTSKLCADSPCRGPRPNWRQERAQLCVVCVLRMIETIVGPVGVSRWFAYRWSSACRASRSTVALGSCIAVSATAASAASNLQRTGTPVFCAAKPCAEAVDG